MATRLGGGHGDSWGRWRTRANALSLARLVGAPLLFTSIVFEAQVAAAALVAFAIATDLTDGPVARRFAESSSLGGLIDHGADALFVSSGLAALASRGVVPWALPLLVVVAFLQYVADSRAARGRPLRPSRLGRANGIAYFVALAVPVGRDALGLSWPSPAAVQLLAWLLVGSTLASILTRFFGRRAGTEPGQREP